jgi:repressor LexA
MADKTDLSERQQEILALITDSVAKRGYPPSVRELGASLGLSSPSSVHNHLSSLVEAGYIRRDPTKPRAIEVVGARPRNRTSTREVPVLGRIAAGSPIAAVEDVKEVLTLPTELTGRGPVFMLEVRGTSMIDDGILDGDLVVVERGAEYADGDIVAALIDGSEATVKRIKRRRDEVTLIPANPALSPQTYTEGVEVIGRVVSVLRRL